MAVPDIVLQEPFILISLSDSLLGIRLQTDQWVFGTVEKVYSGATAFAVTDSVAFPKENSVQIVYGSSIYYMVDITNVFFSENYTP